MSNLFVRKLETRAPLSIRNRREIETLTSRIHHLGPHKDILREGEELQVVNVVLSGWAYRCRLFPDGRRQITALLLPGDMCGSHMARSGALKQTLGTLTPVILAKVPIVAIRALMASDPDMAEALWWQTLNASEIQREWTVSIGRRSAEERLAHLFCEIWTRLDMVGLTHGAECEMPLAQRDLADAMGLSAVHTNRVLKDLRASGLIELHAKRLVIPDQQTLAAFAMFDPAYLHRRAR